MPIVYKCFIALFLCTQATHAQELTLYIMPAPKGINWKSPRTLAFSYIQNAIVKNPYGKRQKHAIGHVIAELKDSTHYALVGTTATSNRYMMHKVMHRGWAAGILFATIAGRLEEADVNVPQVQMRSQNGDIAFVRYKINAANFNRLLQYLEEYRQRNYGQYYNGKNKPREGAGAGCSAFGHSFLEVGGLQHLLNDSAWRVHVHVPERLVGGPEADGRRVPVLLLFLKGRWAGENSKHYRDIYYYEPTMLYNWITRHWQSFPDTGTIRRCSYEKAKGIYIDATNIAAPDEPIWIPAAL